MRRSWRTQSESSVCRFAEGIFDSFAKAFHIHVELMNVAVAGIHSFEILAAG
jgi:hypothetical protein